MQALCRAHDFPSPRGIFWRAYRRSRDRLKGISTLTRVKECTRFPLLLADEVDCMGRRNRGDLLSLDLYSVEEYCSSAPLVGRRFVLWVALFGVVAALGPS